MNHLLADTTRRRHLMQLFDSPDSLATSVSEFLLEGFSTGDQALVIAKPKHWEAIRSSLLGPTYAVDPATLERYVANVDAIDAVARITRVGSPSSRSFVAYIGEIIQRLRDRKGSRLRVYTEMLDLVAERGDLSAARELEGCWNELSAGEAILMFCGYSSAHFGGPAGPTALRQICAMHSHITIGREDVLGSFLYSESQRAADTGAQRKP